MTCEIVRLLVVLRSSCCSRRWWLGETRTIWFWDIRQQLRIPFSVPPIIYMIVRYNSEFKLPAPTNTGEARWCSMGPMSYRNATVFNVKPRTTTGSGKRHATPSDRIAVQYGSHSKDQYRKTSSVVRVDYSALGHEHAYRAPSFVCVYVL